ncbi:YaaL family protein [Bacillus massiliglaciei]|uniref:YaaL family protein n=1 Tax=Bacillus massiliglaciei TaxID=1816693 RepID=UPI000DA61D99|nr:YaaL family protein [Bacillus massiliglaciei]
MFFRRKGRLKNEYDQQLIMQIEQLKMNWLNQKSLLELSVDPSEEVIAQSKLAELKYIYLYKEAKARQVSMGRK